MAITIKRRKGVTSRPSTRHPNSLTIALVASSVVRMQPRVAHSIQTWPTVARGSLRRAGVLLLGDLLHSTTYFCPARTLPARSLPLLHLLDPEIARVLQHCLAQFVVAHGARDSQGADH